MHDCQSCSTNQYKALYEESKASFEKNMAGLIHRQWILIGIVVFCLILTIGFGIKVTNFISDFEYVEETSTTTTTIEQNGEGVNQATIGGVIYGTDSQSNRGNQKEILEKESK